MSIKKALLQAWLREDVEFEKSRMFLGVSQLVAAYADSATSHKLVESAHGLQPGQGTGANIFKAKLLQLAFA